MQGEKSYTRINLYKENQDAKLLAKMYTRISSLRLQIHMSKKTKNKLTLYYGELQVLL